MAPQLIQEIVQKDFWQCTNCSNILELIIIHPASHVTRCMCSKREWKAIVQNVEQTRINW